jgi:REP element-mobilizing transposase RayT
VDKEQSYRWLKFGDLKGYSESTIVTAQYLALSSSYFKRKILREDIENKKLLDI